MLEKSLCGFKGLI